MIWIDHDPIRCITRSDIYGFGSGSASTRPESDPLTGLKFETLSRKFNELSQELIKRSQVNIFCGFKDISTGGFKKSLGNDAEGLLSEDLLDEARSFAVRHLIELTESLASDLKERVARALDVPLPWRPPRLEIRKFIDQYEKEVIRERNDCRVLKRAGRNKKRRCFIIYYECYMIENGAAGEAIKDLLERTWKNLSKEAADCAPQLRSFAEAAVNLAYGDGIGAPDQREELDLVKTRYL
ncbi:(+)-epi-alpha-bisabolol synthase [Apostasia shenzhenica]|uniref:(+)-epi-alpha-bisabolol synthase n=1 Tax=Apostasia shenzhenica TaxID=1088818 RepID=A0A2H9ZTS4_9ASPA|nr:(+)-epi-alpha-bisabolol synthase [Apostasia shenzhenica]